MQLWSSYTSSLRCWGRTRSCYFIYSWKEVVWSQSYLTKFCFCSDFLISLTALHNSKHIYINEDIMIFKGLLYTFDHYSTKTWWKWFCILGQLYREVFESIIYCTLQISFVVRRHSWRPAWPCRRCCCITVCEYMSVCLRGGFAHGSLITTLPSGFSKWHNS